MSEPNPRPQLYRAAAYRADAPEAIVHAYPFASLISPQMHATATPIVFERDGDASRLIGHMARRNAHAQAMRTGDAVLAIFAGPHAYISPRWYVEKPEVPTWNYVAAHVRGRLELIEDDAGQIDVLRRSIDFMEAGFDTPWGIDDAPEGRVEFLLPLIRAFRIHIDSIEGTTKLSQTHPEGDRRRIIDGLRARPDKTVSDYMEERL